MLRRLVLAMIVVVLTACGGGGDSEPTGDIYVSLQYSNLNGKVGTAVQHAPTVSGLPAGANATYRVDGLPTGLNIDPSSGVIYGTPTSPGGGTVWVQMTVNGYEGEIGASLTYRIDSLTLYEWTSISSSAPALEKTHLVSLGGALYAIGHNNSGMAQTWRSMDGGVSWVNLNVAPTTGFRRFAVAALADAIYLTGGSSNQSGANTNEVWRFDGTNWTQVSVVTPFTPRHSHAMLAVGSNLYAIGGVSAQDITAYTDAEPGSGYLNDVWRSADNGVHWTQLTANAAFTPRFGHCALALNNRLYVIGGYDGIDWYGTATMYQSADAGVTWQAAANIPSAGRFVNSGCAVHANRLVIEFGAGYRDYNDDGVRVSPYIMQKQLYTWASDVGWNEETPMSTTGSSVTPTYGHGLAVVGTNLVSVGGKYLFGGSRNVWQSQPATP